jgi:hypothetical protein
MSSDTQQENMEDVEVEHQEEPQVGSKFDWRVLLDRFSYKGIVNNVPFLAFCVLLCVFYIANGHQAIETQRELDKQQKILKELGWRSLDAQSKLMNAGMEAEIIKKGTAIGLKPLMFPAYKIGLDTAR